MENNKYIHMDKYIQILIFGGVLYFFNNPIIKLFGVMCIVLGPILIFFVLFKNNYKIQVNLILLLYIIIFFYNIILLIKNLSLQSIYQFVIQSSIMLLPLGLSNMYINEKDYNRILKILKVLFVLVLLPSLYIILFQNGNESYFSSIYSPVFYKLLLFTSLGFVGDIERKNKFLVIAIISTIFYGIGERTSIICMVVVYVIYKILYILRKNRRLFNFVFIFIFLLIISVPFVYLWVGKTPLIEVLNEWSLKYTHANFYSGRNIIWEIAITAIKSSPLFGYGIANEVLKDGGVYLSTHNLYIFLLLQGGITLLGCFVYFLYSLWKKMFVFIENECVRISASYYIAILIFLVNELSLITNSLGIAVYMWLIISLGIMIKNSIEINIGEFKNKKI